MRGDRERAAGSRQGAGVLDWDGRCRIKQMAPRVIERIRARIRTGQYDMTAHAMEEMAEDDLDVLDVEHALLNGQITRIEKRTPDQTKYVIEGFATNQETLVGVVGRFTDTGRYLIITVYEIID